MSNFLISNSKESRASILADIAVTTFLTNSSGKSIADEDGDPESLFS